MALQDTILQARKGATKFSQGFTAGQKVTTIMIAAVLGLGGMFLLKMTSSPVYSPLFTGLSATDAGAITQKLTAAKVPYQLADGGQTILVPQTQVYQERLDMAQAGLPANSTVGLSLLDKVGITSSQITQQADYQRALQGELASTIEAIQGVTSAQVNLALPPTDVFAVSQSQQATASVLVTLSPGMQLTPGQVQGIVHLVASSIPNLAPGSVTVVDSNGNVLSAPGFNNSAAQDSTATQSFDQSVQASIQSMLQDVLGPGQVDVRVAANLNFNQVKTTSSAVGTNKNGTPQTTPTQVQASTQTYTGTGTPPGGVLGNLTPATGGTQTSNYAQKQSTTNYAVSQINQTVQQAPGQIQNLSVAVLLDSKIKGVPTATIKQLVSAAVGLNPARGDQISIVSLPFSQAAAAQAKAQQAAAQSTSSLASMLGLAKIVVLVIGVLIVMFLMLRAGASSAEEITLDEYSAPLELETIHQPAKQIQITEYASPVSPQVLDFIDRQPEDVAKLLRIWMSSRASR
ncbi:MAG: flagellar M-ring protein FliF [Acidimicrobiaceae bacterium]|nr:flagellar M-ring protein FliF [Acidimicrobiaceae bacterium]